ncbi:MAG: diacylglycerol/lipid kinase family protein [Bacillota bacterium]
MKTLLIVNTHSRSGKSKILAHNAICYLKEKGVDFDFTEIEKFEDAYSISRMANLSGVENIIAVGGDGTINKVLNGFYDNCGAKVSDSRFGVIHTGTSPDFCKSYNIPTDPVKAAGVIVKQKTTNIPVGMIKLRPVGNYPLTDYPLTNSTLINYTPQTMYFACCANTGLGAALARSANSGIRGYAGDSLGTLISLLKILSKYKGADYNICLDGREGCLDNIINISVGLTRFIASGIKVYRDEGTPENMFHIIKLKQVKLFSIIKLLKILYTGRGFEHSSFISMEYASKIEIHENIIHNEVEFDGDPAGLLPCTIETAKDKLPVFTN